MSETDHNAVASPTASVEIAHDLPCRSCGYNLRGLEASGVCPECAAVVRDSLTPDDLNHARLDWLRQVRIGLSLAFAGLLTFVLAVIATLVEAIVSFAHPLPQRSTDLQELIAIVAGIACVVALAGILAGTPPERRLDSQSLTRRVRRCSRTAAIVFVALAIATVAGVTMATRPPFASLAWGATLFTFSVFSISWPLWLHELQKRDPSWHRNESAVVAAYFAACGCGIGALYVLAVGLGLSGLDVCAGVPVLIVVPVYTTALLVATWRSKNIVARAERMTKRDAPPNGAQ